MLGVSANPNCRRNLRAFRSLILANVFLASTMPSYAAGELPSGGQVVAGSGAIAATGNALTVTQSSSRAIINWQSFSIGNGNSVQINNGSGATLNRVIANSPSTIAGSLTSTGSTYLINQNGIVVTPTGKVVTGGSFIGSTRDTSDSAFMQGQAQQFSGASSGNVVNQGKIVSVNGDVVLVGKSVDNSGSVGAGKGTAGLVAGDDVTLQPSGTGLQIKVATGSGDATNSGTVDAAQVMLNAAGGNVYALAGNNGGTIRATGISTINGHVWLTAGGQATVVGSVSAQNADGSGGAIAVTGRNIDISGALDVSAYSPFGSGGSASVIASGTTRVTGTIKARAGSLGGNGGAIETSGNILKIAGATIDAAAPSGLAGAWLLDPYDLTIGASPTDATESPAGSWTSNAGGGLVLNTDINNALNAGTSVVLQTSGSLGDGAGNGDITVSAAIQMTGASAASLTLQAAGSIIVNQSISSTGGALAVTLNSNTLGGGGYVNIGAAITTNGGNLVVGGGATPLTMAAVGTAAQATGVLVNGALDTAGGALTINGAGYGGSVNGNSNNGVSIAAGINAGGGAISITGTGGNSSGSNNIGILQSVAITNTGAGSITLNGTGGGSGIGESGYQTTANITAGTGNISITGVSSATATGNSNRGVGLLGGTVSTAGAGTITVAGTVMGSGSGASAVSANGGVTAVDGLISITGINNSISTGSGNNGVNINSATAIVRSTGTGGITLVGKGGGSGVSGANSGVTWNTGGVVQSTGGGAISITGTGGGNGGSGSSNFGVNIGGGLSGSGGAILITGTGGNASGSNNVGINQIAAITNTGTGSITLNGTGGGSGSGNSNYGANINGAITGGGGAISITGTGGGGSGNGNYGINQGAFAITNTGSGGITLNGTGGGTGASENGYFLINGSVVAGTGNISITGQASTTAKDGVGFLVHGTAISTAGAGTITMSGTAAGTSSAAREDAAVIDMPNITAVDGLISITGINNTLGTIDGNSGLHINSSSQVLSTGTGGISLTGVTGGSGVSFNNYGVQINGGNTVKSTGGGAISITGTGGDAGGSGANNLGVFISSGVGALAGSGGAISIIGTGGNSSGNGNYGINLLSAITNTGAGSITLNGTGGGTGNNELGYFSTQGVTAATGNISITGTASATATGNSNGGIVLSGNPISTSGSGTITLLGTATGNGSASGGNAGVSLSPGSLNAMNGDIRVTGINNSTSTGINNFGVTLGTSPSIRTTGSGNVTVIGFGGGSGASSNNIGVSFATGPGAPAAIQTTGSGSITVTGTGGDSGGSGSSNFGVSWTFANPVQASGGGAITITGTGGSNGGSGSSNYGVNINANANLSGSGGALSITGIGGNSSGSNNYGIVQSGALTNTGAGSITLNGTGGGTGSNEVGYSSLFFGTAAITAGTGDISITGTASANASGRNSGIELNSNSSLSTGGAGKITLFGTAAGSGPNSGSAEAGVVLNSASISAANGLISITGVNNSIGTGVGHVGVMLNSSPGNVINSGAGGVTIIGSGGGSGSSSGNHGIVIGAVQWGGGAIIISGTGGDLGGTGNANVGVQIAQNFAGNGGAISISGLESNSSGGSNYGIQFLSGVTVSNTGTGGVALNGTPNVAGAFGLALPSIAAGAGTITVNSSGFILSSGALTAANLVLLGAGADYTLTNSGNAVTTIAANTGSMNYSQTGDLTVGTVGATVGVNASGTVKLVSNGGNLIIAGGAGVTAGGINNALILEAGASTSQPTVTGGDFINNAGAAALSTPNGHWLVYTGHRAGLGTVDGGLVYTAQYNTDTSYLPGSVFTNFMFFRAGPPVAPVTASLVGPMIKTYDGTLLATLGSGNYNLSGVAPGDAGSVVLTVNGTPIFLPTYGQFSTRNAGSGLLVTVSGLGLDQSASTTYQLTSTTISANIGTINPAQLTLLAVYDQKTYDGTTLSSAIPVISGLQTGDSVTSLSQAFASRNALGVAGSTLVVDNYVLTDGNGGNNYTVQTLAQQGTIFTAPLTISAVSDTKIYDGTTDSSGTPTVDGLVAGDSLTGLKQAFLSKNVLGTNGSVLIPDYMLDDGNGGHNYSQIVFNAAGTITPAQLTISAVSDTKVYDGTTASSAAPAVSGLFTAGGDSITGLTQSFGSKNVLGINGSTLSVTSYTLNDGNGGNNYMVTSSATAAGTITPASLFYTADLVSRTYGQSNPDLDGTLTGLKGSDTRAMVASGKLKFKSTTSEWTNVGSYAITGSGLHVISANYLNVINQDAGNATALTVNPAPLTYTAVKASRTYGAADPAFSGTVTGFVLGQTRSSATTGTMVFDTTATDSSNVGQYAIYGSGLTAKFGNYYFMQAAANDTALTINPAQLTYVADPASRTYGAANPVFSGTVTGFVLGQTQATATSGTLLFTSPATASSNVGKYAINGSGLTADFGNYYFVQAKDNAKALTITPATLTYTADAASRPRHADNPHFTGTVTGFVLGQTRASATTGALIFGSPATRHAPAGNYAINGSGLAANHGNYVFVQAASNATALAVLP